MRVNYDDATREEGFEAAEWYGAQQKTLQTRFLAKWKDAENRMVASPQIHRCFEGDLPSAVSMSFPMHWSSASGGTNCKSSLSCT